jgi:hypothetical protein
MRNVLSDNHNNDQPPKRSKLKNSNSLICKQQKMDNVLSDNHNSDLFPILVFVSSWVRSATKLNTQAYKSNNMSV